MAKNDSTIIFLSQNSTRVKQYRISKIKFLTFTSLFLIVFLVAGKYMLDVMIDFRYDNKVKLLQRTNKFLQNQLSEMGQKLSLIDDQLTQIGEKDDEIRMIMGVKELGDDMRDVGIGGSEYEYKLTDDVLDPATASDLSRQMVLLDKLEREVKLELESYDDLIATYYAKQDSLKHMPALHPVLEGRVTSDFGMRVHPILKRYRNHPGIDFSAKMGTPIYAAADGVIQMAKYNGGYGNCVIIDHQYGFETRYGHMQKILVRHGQKVKRGDKIGLVGKTGLATAPHLHFEVHFRGKEVNPRHYFFDDAELNKAVVENRP